MKDTEFHVASLDHFLTCFCLTTSLPVSVLPIALEQFIRSISCSSLSLSLMSYSCQSSCVLLFVFLWRFIILFLLPNAVPVLFFFSLVHLSNVHIRSSLSFIWTVHSLTSGREVHSTLSIDWAKWTRTLNYSHTRGREASEGRVRGITKKNTTTRISTYSSQEKQTELWSNPLLWKRFKCVKVVLSLSRLNPFSSLILICVESAVSVMSSCHIAWAFSLYVSGKWRIFVEREVMTERSKIWKELGTLLPTKATKNILLAYYPPF